MWINTIFTIGRINVFTAYKFYYRSQNILQFYATTFMADINIHALKILEFSSLFEIDDNRICARSELISFPLFAKSIAVYKVISYFKCQNIAFLSLSARCIVIERKKKPCLFIYFQACQRVCDT